MADRKLGRLALPQKKYVFFFFELDHVREMKHVFFLSLEGKEAEAMYHF